MKKYCLLFILTLVLASCGTDSHHFKIDGHFLNLNQGEFYVYSPDGDINISIKTLVYQTGVDYIRKLLIKLGYKPHKKENNEFQDNDIK